MNIIKPLKSCLLLFNLLVFSHLTFAQQGFGLPVWSVSNLSDSGFQVIDWRTSGYSIQTFNINSPTIHCPTVPAVSHCGEPVFYVRHSGMPNASNNLFFYSLDGEVLLDNSTPNGPGLNAKRTAYELQVMKVPQTINEWYIIYCKWVSDVGAPLGNGGYTPSNFLYSRVRFRCGALEVLERDITLKAGNSAYTYTTGMAVSATADPDRFYLYGCRRSESANYLSLDRFSIDNEGITYEANTGNINAAYSIFAIDAAPIVVSNDGKRIGLCNRNDDLNEIDFILFDAEEFSNAPVSYQAISAGDLILQPDNQVLFTPMSIADAANNVPTLNFLINLERKLVQISFSPSSYYLYFTHGGFIPSGGFNVYTYLGQIEIGPYNNPESYPYKVRLQIEEPPNPWEPFDGTRHIQQCFDGNMYFCKWTTPFIYVLPNPDSLLENNLIPGKIDLSDSSHPNIPVNGTIWYVPDQIDGYDYMTSINPSINLGNDTIICMGNDIILSPGGQFESYCWQDGSSDPIYNVTGTGNYWVEVIDEFGCYAHDTIQIQYLGESINLGNDTTICQGESLVITPGNNYLQYLWQDGSPNSEFIVTETGNYWVEVTNEYGCTDKDTIGVFVLNENITLGDDMTICMGDSIVLTPGNGFTNYLWQDGSVASSCMAKDAGHYWVEVSAGSGCEARDTIIVTLIPRPVINLGQDKVLETGESLVLDAGPGFMNYIWQDGSSNQWCQVSTQGLYWVKVSNGFCETTDSILIIMNDCVASLSVPNCFTPNGDGFNERFHVVAKNIYGFSMLIFNRWGQLIFETSDINEGWDGKANGATCPIGTYFYLIRYETECTSGVDKSGEKVGPITLLE